VFFQILCQGEAAGFLVSVSVSARKLGWISSSVSARIMLGCVWALLGSERALLTRRGCPLVRVVMFVKLDSACQCRCHDSASRGDPGNTQSQGIQRNKVCCGII
jgi:hypothetical protein